MLTSGIDLIEIERVGRALERHGRRFANRIFTPAEQADCHGRLPSLAGRFAVKEAVAKALGTGIGDIRWLDIEIVTADNGRPTLQLHNHAHTLARRQGYTNWSISLSHTDTHAIGMAVATGQQEK